MKYEYVIEYLNENEFKKLERAIKKYNMIAYKKLMFEYYPSLRDGKFIGEKVGKDKYEKILPTDRMFAQLHGECKLIYSVYEKEKIIMLENIEPKDLLLEGHHSELTTYKGVMISKTNKEKDMFKIDLLNMLHNDD